MRWAKLQSFTSSFLVMLRAKNYQNWPVFHEVIKKNKSGFVFLKHCVCCCGQWLTSQIGLSGAGIVGVVEANFLDPIHNKQEFDKTDRYKQVIVDCFFSVKAQEKNLWQCNVQHVMLAVNALAEHGR